jgi:5'-3' exonuclease
MDKILLIDLANNLYRACVKFGTPPVQDVDDSIIFTFNFFRNLRPIIEQFSPDKVFIVGEGHPQFRYDLYSEYKANRIIKTASKQESKDKFSKTMDIVLPLLAYLPITIARAANYEADDTIGSLCENMKEEDLTVLSSDTDFIQLLQRGYKHIQIYNPIKKVFVEAPPWPYALGKAITGDKSDNIPALLKPKKAQETIRDPEKFKAFMSLEENRANFQINRQLVEFASVPEEEIVLTEGTRQFDLLKAAFVEMKFESITNDKSWERFTTTFDCIKY